MTMFIRAAIAAALLGGVALPAAAQDASPSPAMPGHGMGQGGVHGGKAMRFMFRNLSPEGQQTMRSAFQGLRNDGTREQIKAARDRQLALLEADRLDVGALQRAMLDERNLAQGAHQRMQQALLQSYQQLSVADRRSIVASARQARQWMENRRDERRASGREPAAPQI